MWQRFTEDARDVILLGQQEAIKVGASQVENQHLLLGVLAVSEKQGNQLFGEVGLDASMLHRAILESFRESSRGTEPDATTLSPMARRTLELAADEARRLRHNQIRPEHVFLSLLRAEDIKQIFQSQDVGLSRVRETVREVIESTVIEFDEETVDVLALASQWANLSQSDIRSEQLLLSLLERREDLLVEILGLDVLALKKSRLRLAVRLDMFEEAALLRDEIEKEHS